MRQVGNRTLLWHGVPLASLPAVLARGVCLPHASTPDSALLLGRGIYFTDMIRPAVHDARMAAGDTTCLLLLCEVALGKVRFFFFLFGVIPMPIFAVVRNHT